MSQEKVSAFDRATAATTAEVVDDEDGIQPNVPRAIFTHENQIDISKLQISQLRLAQGMTAEVNERKAAIGQFVLSNFPAYDEVVLVPFGAPNIRLYKPDPKAAAKCSAPTGDFGFGNPGGECVLCPLSHWGEKDPISGKSTPPPCKEGVLVRAYSATHRSMVDMQFLGSERQKGSFIQQQAMSFGWGNFAIKLTSHSKANNRGSWFVPEVEMLNDVPDEHKEIAGKWYGVFLTGLAETKEAALRQLSAGQGS